MVKKKAAKSKTMNKVRNRVNGTIRQSFKMHSPMYDEAKKRARVEIPKYKKDGTLAKLPEVWYRCAKCDKLEKDTTIEVDHINKVSPLGITSSVMSLNMQYRNVCCHIDNLQVLCEKCHDAKTKKENEEDKLAKGKTRFIVYETVNIRTFQRYVNVIETKDFTKTTTLGPEAEAQIEAGLFERHDFERWFLFVEWNKSDADKRLEIINNKG